MYSYYCRAININIIIIINKNNNLYLKIVKQNLEILLSFYPQSWKSKPYTFRGGIK